MQIKEPIYIVISLIVLLAASCKKKDTLFTSLPSSTTHIDFNNKLEPRKGFGILYYLYYYNGGGVATGDINNDGLPDIYFTANSFGNNKLYLNKGNFEFEDITEKAGIKGAADWSSGVTMADVNGDGLLDIYVCVVSQVHDLQGHNQLFINNGNNTFTESSAAYGLDFSGFSTQAAFFDYDHDGDLDCFLLNQSNRPNENIVDTSKRRRPDAYTGDRLYRNDLNTGSKRFVDVSATAGIYQSSLGYGLGLAVADMNNDGWDDLYIGNDFHENDYYYVNNGNGTFTESGAKHFAHYSRFSMGNDVADYNNDGEPDVFTADMLPGDEKILKTYGSDENPDIYKYKLIKNGFQYQYSRNSLQRNNGSGGTFSETGLISGISATDWSWSALFADFDNDGNKDLFISSGIVKRPVDLDYVRYVSNLAQQKGNDFNNDLDEKALERMPDGASHPYFYKGDGDLQFADVSSSWGTAEMKGYYNGASYADLDNDGRLDVVINAINEKAVVLKNSAPVANYISIKFKGDSINTKGIGAKAYLFQKGKMQYQQLMATRGFQSSVDERLHFGTGNTAIDSLLIVWPDQTWQVIDKPGINQQIVVDQATASGKFNYSSFFPSLQPILSTANNLSVNWQHHENQFEDFNAQYLIPHAESTRGPKIAVADVNGDGLDDFYACGAKGQAGVVMLQQANGSFVSVDENVFAVDAGSEDVDAVFFDANGDGFKDLYVVSGGNELSGNDAMADRLYLNNGKGHFVRSASLPAIFSNKSCVAVADVDRDGDHDLFIGTLSDPKAYGLPQTSYLLINDGKANFTIAGKQTIDLENIGMVTCASFADINKDGMQDLVIAGEFMPVTIFMNHGGKFEASAVPYSTGWWQTLLVDDINNDGQPDILAGNYGYNNKFWSGKDGPVKLYVGDFDNNGQTDQLLSYTSHGKEYPFLAKDEVERPLPLLKKHYLSYGEYAGVEMKDVFYGWIETAKPIIAEQLGSAMFIGKGDGSFKMEPLPSTLQLAPIFCFLKLPYETGTYLAGGNFFDVIPYEGRYDAQPLALFSVKNNQAKWIPQPSLLNVNMQVRDIKLLRTAQQNNVVMVAPNNTSPQFFSLPNNR